MEDNETRFQGKSASGIAAPSETVGGAVCPGTACFADEKKRAAFPISLGEINALECRSLIYQL